MGKRCINVVNIRGGEGGSSFFNIIAELIPAQPALAGCDGITTTFDAKFYHPDRPTENHTLSTLDAELRNVSKLKSFSGNIESWRLIETCSVLKSHSRGNERHVRNSIGFPYLKLSSNSLLNTSSACTRQRFAWCAHWLVEQYLSDIPRTNCSSCVLVFCHNSMPCRIFCCH